MENCKLCTYTSTKNRLMVHMIKNHSNERHFVLSCKHCGKTYSKYESLRKHIYRKHSKCDDGSEDLRSDHDLDVSCESTDNDDDTNTSGVEEKMNEVQNHCAAFILQLRSAHNVSRN